MPFPGPRGGTAGLTVSVFYSGRKPLGSQKKPSRIRPSRLPGATTVLAAAPAVAGLAAAFCLAPQTGASAAVVDSTVHATAITVSATQPAPRFAELLSATRAAGPQVTQGSSQRKSNTSQVWHTVRSGDTLSSIAGRYYHTQAAWPVLYWANHSQIRSADLIEPGQRLLIPPKPARIPAPPASAIAAPAAPAAAPVAETSQAPQTSVSYAPTRPAATSYTGASGSYAACVIARESGGNSQVMNASGHYGLYQFSASTWAAYGGNPADFGNASVSEQNQVFNNAIAAGGQSNWSPYDGC
ncbi:MAG TPA: LysM peptidoglycan-binding domain-containing protein [Streptosporangiaceae bacterium]